MEETGMTAFITALTTGLSPDNLWAAIVPVASLMIIVTTVAIGRRLAQKNLNSAVKGTGAKVK